MMHIQTAADLFSIASAAEYHRWLLGTGIAKQRLRQYGLRAPQLGAPDSPDTAATSAYAYVNHGRWVADCPSGVCSGAMAIMPRVPFMCGTCLNAECGYKYRPLEWPQERGRIEEILSARLMPQTVNWYPGETIEKLMAESVAA